MSGRYGGVRFIEVVFKTGSTVMNLKHAFLKRKSVSAVSCCFSKVFY